MGAGLLNASVSTAAYTDSDFLAGLAPGLLAASAILNKVVEARPWRTKQQKDPTLTA